MNTTTGLAREVMLRGSAAARREQALLFERAMRRIDRYFRRMTRQSDVADDCTQRTLELLTASLQHGKYDPGRSFNAWMWLKARTVFAQWCRDRERGAPPVIEAPPVDELERSTEARRLLQRLADAVDEATFETVVLFYESGLTRVELAELLGCDRKTIYNRINRAHRVLSESVRT